MDDILIGINRELAIGMESFLNEMDYTKHVEEDIVYFNLEVEDWEHPHNPIPSELMSYLFLVVGQENYGFVRFGERPDDTEIHGTLENFDINITRSLSRS